MEPPTRLRHTTPGDAPPGGAALRGTTDLRGTTELRGVTELPHTSDRAALADLPAVAGPPAVAEPSQVVELSQVTQLSQVVELSALVEAITDQVPDCTDVELVDLITHLETLKNQCCALQAHAALALEDTRLHEASTPRQREAAHRSVISELALARRESPHRARTLLGLATALTTELPHTMAHLSAGRISEYRATLVARETACLDPAQRLAADHTLATDLPTWSNREVAARAREVAYALDPHGVVTHIARAESERRVSVRPAPDCMTVLTALLPVAQGAAVHATLLREVERARAAGDPRGRGQVMADTLVTRITGQTTASAVPLEIQLVITDDTLLADGDTPARLTGFGPIPPAVARRLITLTDTPSTSTSTVGTHPGSDTIPGTDTHPGTDTDPGTDARRGAETDPGTGSGATTRPHTDTDAGTGADQDQSPDEGLDEETRHWIRRLYAHPHTGQLIHMESTRRIFPTGLRRFITARDDNTCRTPWCGAPIAHIDHVTPVRNAGPTTADNAQGLRIHCNQAKEAPRWHAQPEPDATITTTTPTGHTHTTRPPPLPHYTTHTRDARDTANTSDTPDTGEDTAETTTDTHTDTDTDRPHGPHMPQPRSRAPAA